jgi:hypothetical protein
MSSTLHHRLQILLDDQRYARITAAARERGVPVASVVREAIDHGLSASSDRRRLAAAHLLDAAEMEVPDPSALSEELEQLRARRG